MDISCLKIRALHALKEIYLQLMYETIAQYYDLIHESLTDDVRFVLQLAEQTEGPILELGCGTGRLLLPLAYAGHAVTGLDLAPAMLARAKRKLSEKTVKQQGLVTLVEGDMRRFKLESRFGLAIIPHNTLMHLESDEVRTSLICIRQHLKPGALLFLDVDNPMEMAQRTDDDLLILERVLNDNEAGQTLLQFASSWVDTAQQSRHTTWIIDVTPVDGGTLRRTVAQAVFHYLYPHEIQLHLQEAGFDLESMRGDYDGTPYSEDSQRLLVVAKVT